MLTFDGCVFSAAGASRKAQVFGLTLNGAEDVLINDCTFNGTGYSGLLNKTTGDVTVKDCKFECDNFYNPIEGSQTVAQGALVVEDCNFTGTCGNNFINFYQVQEDSVHTIKGCKFHGSTSNNVIRLSNRNNAEAIFNIEDVTYEFTSGEPNEYTGFILCQDYTNRTGAKQDFSKYTINLNNVVGPEEGHLVYVYEDGQGIITTNYPVITRDGQPLVGEE